MYLYHIRYTSNIIFLTPWGSLHQIFCSAFSGMLLLSQSKRLLQLQRIHGFSQTRWKFWIKQSSITFIASCSHLPSPSTAASMRLGQRGDLLPEELGQFVKDGRWLIFYLYGWEASNSLCIPEDLSQMQNPNRSLATSGHRRSLQQGLMATGAYHLPAGMRPDVCQVSRRRIVLPQKIHMALRNMPLNWIYMRPKSYLASISWYFVHTMSMDLTRFGYKRFGNEIGWGVTAWTMKKIEELFALWGVFASMSSHHVS